MHIPFLFAQIKSANVILNDPQVVTRENTELLRIEQRDFKAVWQVRRNKLV